MLGRCFDAYNIRTQLNLFRTTILCSWNIFLELLKYFPGSDFEGISALGVGQDRYLYMVVL
jgi:hypothetical protein